jgi:hypothetical protein
MLLRSFSLGSLSETKGARNANEQQTKVSASDGHDASDGLVEMGARTSDQ